MKKTTALLINPLVCDFKLYDEWMHPVGLYLLYDFLEKSGISTHFFNFLDPGFHTQKKKHGTGSFEYVEITKPDLYQSIKRKYKLYGRSAQSFITFLSTIPRPDIVCIGGTMTYWAPGIIETYKLIRQHLPETTILCGGIAAQLIPDYLAANMPCCKIIGNIERLQSISVPDINFGNLPIDLSRLSMNSCLATYSSLPHAPVLLSLGCPMRCSYCASGILQPNHQVRDIDIVISEVASIIEQRGTTDFAFYDDALLYQKESILFPFLERIGAPGKKVRFHTPNGLHVRYMDNCILDKMIHAGLETLRFGYESGQSQHHTAVSGKVNREQLAKKVSMALASGFSGRQIGVYVMGGLPRQTPEDLCEEMDFIHSLGVSAKPVFISPVPGTALFKDYAASFPEIKTDPLWHNDTFFITNLECWDDAGIETIRQKARKLNSSLQ
ncbi:MAG TPA: B12-binding domain-containing radical SAM protein [Chitinispirillaceae bacterium]|nr:B12-binding domain-containing radical SAM protein [Chitinispirillaceae bacterium]